MQLIQDFLENTQLPVFDPAQGFSPQTNEALGNLGVGIDGKSCSEVVGKCFEHKIPMLSGWRTVEDPRDESYCGSISQYVWPTLKFKSMTTGLAIVQICVFLASVIVGINREGSFLTISYGSLKRMKAMMPIELYKGHIYESLISLFLHYNFQHFVVQLLSLMIVCSRLQYTMGPWLTLSIYLVSGISGNLVHCILTTTPFIPSVGNLSSLFGLAGAHIGYLVMNWKGLEFLGRLLRYHLMGLILFNASIGAVMGLAVAIPGDVGQTGGAITGFLMVGLAKTIEEGPTEKRMRWVFLAMAALVNVGVLVGVYGFVGRQYA